MEVSPLCVRPSYPDCHILCIMFLNFISIMWKDLGLGEHLDKSGLYQNNLILLLDCCWFLGGCGQKRCYGIVTSSYYGSVA